MSICIEVSICSSRMFFYYSHYRKRGTKLAVFVRKWFFLSFFFVGMAADPWRSGYGDRFTYVQDFV